MLVCLTGEPVSQLQELQYRCLEKQYVHQHPPGIVIDSTNISTARETVLRPNALVSDHHSCAELLGVLLDERMQRIDGSRPLR
jgi:hypothetical protein